MGLRAMPFSQGQGQVQPMQSGGAKSMQPPQPQMQQYSGGVPWNLAAQMARTIQPSNQAPMPTRNIQPVRNPTYGQPTSPQQYGQMLSGPGRNV